LAKELDATKTPTNAATRAPAKRRWEKSEKHVPTMNLSNRPARMQRGNIHFIQLDELYDVFAQFAKSAVTQKARSNAPSLSHPFAKDQ